MKFGLKNGSTEDTIQPSKYTIDQYSVEQIEDLPQPTLLRVAPKLYTIFLSALMYISLANTIGLAERDSENLE